MGVCVRMFQAEDRRFRGRAPAFGRAEQHPGDEAGETQPSGRRQDVFTNCSSVMDLLVWHRGTNLITPVAVA